MIFGCFSDSYKRFEVGCSGLFSEDLGRAYFPKALVGSYAVYPHKGHRYWYDYFEPESDAAAH
ncbi:MAG: hypothetical protein M2R45_05366 [Verrucomicrobia subdivision 3 bacterium]|nr:hypothetical protein [Limisphaerales bacterium]MCS1417778.1 hypothetical protein [Limisphaerales bacterium]